MKIIEEIKRRRDNKRRQEACKAAIHSGSCPQNCQKCAWYTGGRR